MRRNHRVAPWLPVIPVILGPSDTGGDSELPTSCPSNVDRYGPRFFSQQYRPHMGDVEQPAGRKRRCNSL